MWWLCLSVFLLFFTPAVILRFHLKEPTACVCSSLIGVPSKCLKKKQKKTEKRNTRRLALTMTHLASRLPTLPLSWP